MAEIISLEQRKRFDTYKILHEEKLANKDDTARKTFEEIKTKLHEPNSVSNKEDIKSIIKVMLPLKLTEPGFFHEIRLLLVEQAVIHFSMGNKEKSRRDVRKLIADYEKEISKEDAVVLNSESGGLDHVQKYCNRFFVFIQLKDQYIMDATGQLDPLSIENFATRHSHIQIFNSKTGEYESIGEYVVKFNMLPMVDKLAMRPNQERFIREGDKLIYNTWQPFPHENVVFDKPEEHCALFLNHVKNIVCNGNQKNFELFMAWWADMRQRPERKPGVAMFMWGKEGTGKDITIEYASKTIHSNHVSMIDDSTFDEKHNPWQEAKLLIACAEKSRLASRKSIAKLKAMITAETILISKKWSNLYAMDCKARFTFTSNEDDVFKLNDDSRRIMVFHVSNKYGYNQAPDYERKAYFQKLVAEMEGNGPAALDQILRTWLITEDIKTMTIDTPEVIELRENTKDGFDEFCSRIRDGEVPGSIPDNLPTIILNVNEETKVERDIMKHYYKCFTRGEYTSVHPEKLPKKLIEGLGLQWLGKKNNDKHFKRFNRTEFWYVFPPLDKWE